MKRKKDASAVRSATVDRDNETAEQKIARLERETAELEKGNTVSPVKPLADARCSAVGSTPRSRNGQREETTR